MPGHHCMHGITGQVGFSADFGKILAVARRDGRGGAVGFDPTNGLR